jgi:hypothetical protein
MIAFQLVTKACTNKLYIFLTMYFVWFMTSTTSRSLLLNITLTSNNFLQTYWFCKYLIVFSKHIRTYVRTQTWNIEIYINSTYHGIKFKRQANVSFVLLNTYKNRTQGTCGCSSTSFRQLMKSNEIYIGK